MAAFIISLIPLIEALISGSAGTVTLAQWITIGAQALTAGPTVVEDLPKILAALHPTMAKLEPAFDTFVVDLKKDGAEKAAINMHQSIQAWCAENGDAALRREQGAGYDA